MVDTHDLNVNLSPDEQEYLVNLLKNELKEKRVEEHRTRKPSYRSGIIQSELVIVSLLDKLGQPRETVMGS